jgi:vesicle coat complex subunit
VYSIGEDVSSLFPDIVRQLFVSDAKVKRLAHICLKLLADSHPEVVLLCVNAIQRDGSDIDPLTRGTSVRTSCSIRSKEIAEGALAAIQKGSVDSSVYVRKCAAISILGLVRNLEDDARSEEDEMVLILDRLMGDAEPTVISTTLMVFWLIGNKNYAVLDRLLTILHPHFAKVVAFFPNLDWVGQLYGTHVLHAYCVKNFSVHSTSDHYQQFIRALSEIVQFSTSDIVVQAGFNAIDDLDELNALSDSHRFIERRLFHCPSESAGIFVAGLPDTRLGVKPFLINTFSDDVHLKTSKIQMLSRRLNARNASFLLSECVQYIHSVHEGSSPEGTDFIKACVSLIVRIGSEFTSDLHEASLRALVAMIDSHTASISNEAVQAVRALIQSNHTTEDSNAVMKKACIYLSSVIETISSPMARASAIWLINMCHDTVPIVAPNVLRAVGRTLESEDCTVKLQLSILSIKVLAFHEKNAASDASSSSVPREVSATLLDPLRELCGYIFAVASKDRVVGSIAHVVSSGKIDVARNNVENQFSASRLDKSTSKSQRPEVDSSDSLRTPKVPLRSQVQDSKSMSSEQSTTNRMYRYLLRETILRHIKLRECSHDYETTGSQSCAVLGRFESVFHYIDCREFPRGSRSIKTNGGNWFN